MIPMYGVSYDIFLFVRMCGLKLCSHLFCVICFYLTALYILGYFLTLNKVLVLMAI